MRPCPFCSSDKLDEKTQTCELDGETLYQGYIECWDCGARGPHTAWYSGMHEDAIHWLREMNKGDEGWNARAAQGIPAE